MTSTRLPGKVLLPLAGAPLLQRLLERVRRSRRLDTLAVSTTRGPADDAVAALCHDLGIACFRGSETDVLDRMLKATEWLSGDVMVRLTGDNPMVGGDLVDHLIEAFLAVDPRPIYAHTLEGTGFPLGLCAEAISTEALRLAATSDDPMDREHVTYYVRRRPEKYRILPVSSPIACSGASLTIDTEEDYHRVRSVFEALYARSPAFGFQDVAALEPIDVG